MNSFCLPDMSQLSCSRQPLSAAAILQIVRSVTEGVRPVFCMLHTDRLLPKGLLPPPSLLVLQRPHCSALSHYVGEMFGVSLRHPVALSDSIMPLSGSLAAAAHSLCVSASVWIVSSSSEFLFLSSCFLFIRLKNNLQTDTGFKCHSAFT